MGLNNLYIIVFLIFKKFLWYLLGNPQVIGRNLLKDLLGLLWLLLVIIGRWLYQKGLQIKKLLFLWMSILFCLKLRMLRKRKDRNSVEIQKIFIIQDHNFQFQRYQKHLLHHLKGIIITIFYGRLHCQMVINLNMLNIYQRNIKFILALVIIRCC